VTVPKSVSFAVIAKAAGATPEAVAALNPELRRGRTPPDVVDYPVRIPRGKREQFAKTFPQLRGDWDGFDAYVMRHGERFEDVAKTHGITPRKLRELNGVTDLTEVRGGTIIVVPKLDDDERARNKKAADDDLYHSEITPGGPDEPMLVPVPDKDFALAGMKRVFYRVVSGDTLEQIAGVLGVRESNLAAWNGLDVDAKLHPRMVVVAYVPPAFDPVEANVSLLVDSRLMVVTTGSAEHLDLVEGRKGRVRKKLVVKKGDTLESLGKPHGLSKYDVARINRRGYTTPLEVGEEIIVYQIVDRKKAKAAGVKDTTWKNRPKKKATTTKGKAKGKGKGKAKAKGKGKDKPKPRAKGKGRV
jgi:membrane-bound lytic murein transglycosylase D